MVHTIDDLSKKNNFKKNFQRLVEVDSSIDQYEEDDLMESFVAQGFTS